MLMIHIIVSHQLAIILLIDLIKESLVGMISKFFLIRFLRVMIVHTAIWFVFSSCLS